jgi:tyrosinase
MGLTNFTDFRNFLESPVHGPPHGWVGGIMANPLISPRDPIFYFHHSMVDKVWQDWTNLGNTSTFVGDGFNAGNVMYTFSSNPNTPFPATNPNNITDSRTLGIFYSNAIAQQTTLEQYTVANNTLPTEKFVYQYLIVAENDFIVPNGGDAELRSCEKIVLDGDFKVELGGSFFAMVDTDCDFGTAARVASVQDEPIRPVAVETGNRPWKGVKAYPNPFMGTNLQFEFTLEKADEISLEITNTFGQVLQQPLTTEFLEAGSHVYSLGKLSMSPGIYYLVLRTTSGKTESFRVVKM